MTNDITEAIMGVYGEWGIKSSAGYRARGQIIGWTSPRMYRLAAKAAMAVLEAGLEGERLGRTEGDG